MVDTKTTHVYATYMATKFTWDYFGDSSGQALLIVVLVMVIALTVGLSLASRSITSLRSSTEEANSQAAFSAAEAGVEQAVKLGDVTGTSILSGVSLNDKNNSTISNVDIQTVSGDQFLLNNGNPIFQDDGTDIWLSPHVDTPSKLFNTSWNGTLMVHWGTSNDSSGCSDPAMEILVISGASRTSPAMKKYAFDACAARRSVNSFCAIGAASPCPPSASGAFTVNGINGTGTFNYRASITITNGFIARVIPLYKAGSIGVIGGGLPPQGKIITSTGTAGQTNALTVRKVSFFVGYDSVPSEIFYSLFSAK